MDWKQYTEQPDEGLFDEIQHRLHVRRLWRVGGWVAAVAVLATVGIVALGIVSTQDSRQQAEPTAEAVLPAAGTVAPDVVDQPAVQQQVAVVPSEARRDVAVAEPVVAATVADSVVEAPRMQSAVEPKQSERVAEAVVAAPAAVATLSTSTVQPGTPREPQATEQAVAAKIGQPAVDSSYRFSILKAPNVIVPGDDADEVRRFKVTPLESISDFSIMIFNRRGKRVYSSKDQAFAWDGTHEGQPLPQGAYVWVASFRDASGMPHTERGTVTVLR